MLTLTRMLLLVAAFAFGVSLRPQDVVGEVLAEFRRYPLVGLGEEHQVQEFHSFALKLLADRRSSRTFQDVVVECGNSLYQPVMDRYIAGKSVPRAELQQVWRNTKQWLTWNSPVYRHLFEGIRAINLELPKGRRYRVVLADPPVDWSRSVTPESFRKFARRDDYWATTIEREVLAKHHRGLLIVGGLHLARRSWQYHFKPAPRAKSMVAGILEQERPRSLCSISVLTGDFARQFSGDARMPRFIDLHKSKVGKESYMKLIPKSVVFLRKVRGKQVMVKATELSWPRMSIFLDGLICLSPKQTVVDAEVSEYDPEYLAELRKRAKIFKAVYGFDLEPDLDKIAANRHKTH